MGSIKKQHFPFSTGWQLGQTLSYSSQHYQQHFSSLALPKRQSCPDSLAYYKFTTGVSSALPLAPFLQGFLLVQNSLCLEGLRACSPMRSCHSSAPHVDNIITRQAQGCFSCIPGQKTQWQNKFRKAKKGVFVIEMCHTFENTTPFFCM